MFLNPLPNCSIYQVRKNVLQNIVGKGEKAGDWHFCPRFILNVFLSLIEDKPVLWVSFSLPSAKFYGFYNCKKVFQNTGKSEYATSFFAFYIIFYKPF